MSEPCNSCGAQQETDPCTYCSTALCIRCKRNHEFVCEQAQRRKGLGLGPTIRVLPKHAPTLTFEQQEQALTYLQAELDDIGGEG
jgi:hypothetical protein